jgi:hypothetical protein
MAAGFLPQDYSLALTAADATVQFDSLEVYDLQSVWPQQGR